MVILNRKTGKVTRIWFQLDAYFYFYFFKGEIYNILGTYYFDNILDFELFIYFY